MKRHFWGLSDPGLVRSVNQDDFYYDPDGRFFMVADGMGGHAGGQEASRIAIKTIRTYLEENWDLSLSAEDLLKNAIEKANQEILEDQYSNPERADMGTTAVIVLFRENNSWCTHVGDSRLYRLRGLDLDQITEDHTWVGRAVRSGDLTLEQAKIHPWRHVLSQCLGRKDLYQIEVQSFAVESGDRLVLCSDGLTEEVPDEVIRNLLRTHPDCKEAASVLIEAAKNNGGSDNITVIVVAEE
jgi:protein phosphatase